MITREEVEAAQASWGRMVVSIGAADDWDTAHERALSLIPAHYMVGEGTLLFCPTKAADTPFRPTLKSAVSYFVGRHEDHEEDGGFALEPWSSVRFDNAGVICQGDLAMAMGTYFFGRADGSELRVEYSFVYSRGDDGGLRIQLHHSALPYQR